MRVITDEEVLDNDYYRWVMKGVVCGVGVYEKDGCDYSQELSQYQLKKVVDTDVKESKIKTYQAKDVKITISGYELKGFQPNDFFSRDDVNLVTKHFNQPEEIDMSNQNRVVSVKFFDDDAGLKAEHSLVAEYQVTTRVSDQMTISKVLLTEDVAGDIAAHNEVRAATVDLHILKQTGNKVMLQPIEFEELRVEVRQV